MYHQIKNPILRGFNPDPSIIRVGDEYFIATSTLEWYPGVQIHHSRDLSNWKLLCRSLHRLSQLDMAGVPDNEVIQATEKTGKQQGILSMPGRGGDYYEY